MNKRAIQLSINFIVLFILAMAMFATGVAVLNKVLYSAEELRKELSEQQRQQIERVLLSGPDSVKTGQVTKTLRAGDSDVFGFGVRNDLTNTQHFYYKVVCDMATDNDKIVLCDNNCASICGNWMLLDEASAEIEVNKVKIQQSYIIVPKDAKRGQYIFDLKVCTDPVCGANNENQYDTTKKLYVKVI